MTVSLVDPKGNDTLLHRNALGQLVRHESRAVQPSGNPLRYGTDFFYDLSDRLVQVDVENVDELGDPRPNTHATTAYAYDALGNPELLVREIDQASSATTAFEVEPNHILVRLPEAVNGNQPDNCVLSELDERGLPLRAVRAPGHPDQSTVEYDHDAAGRLALVREGLESGPRETALVRDGLGRLTGIVDAMGNERTFSRDENGNVTSARLDGELVDVPGSAGNVRLRETLVEYDAMDRPIRVDRAFFEPSTQAPFGDGLATTVFEHGPLGRLLRVVDDHGNETTYAYDTAGRPSVVVGNDRTITIGHDESSNVETITEVEHDQLTATDEVYLYQLAYDELDRLIQVVDPVGNTSIRSYDSHHRLVRAQDPEGHLARWQYRLDSAPGAGLSVPGPHGLHARPGDSATAAPVWSSAAGGVFHRHLPGAPPAGRNRGRISGLPWLVGHDQLHDRRRLPARGRAGGGTPRAPRSASPAPCSSGGTTPASTPRASTCPTAEPHRVSRTRPVRTSTCTP